MPAPGAGDTAMELRRRRGSGARAGERDRAEIFRRRGVHLADPIFDHSKIAIIDAMTRQGLPPVNPVFGAVGAAGRLVYYYLWHFSAAELALPLRVSGWEADIGLTWFTAFASLTLMMGIAVWLSKRSGRGALGRRSRRRDLAAHDAELAVRQLRAGTVPGVADRLCRLAVSVRLGAPTSDVGIMRGRGDAVYRPLRAAARARRCC